MKANIIIFTALILTLLALPLLASCGSKSENKAVASSPVQATVNGDYVSIPGAEVEKNINSKFTISYDEYELSFMAYQFGEKTQIRADICPPCRSESFTLVGNTLVCDTCGTVFKAETGEGIRGACVQYPKTAVPYETVDGKITMNGADLVKAYIDTLERG